ncbi:sulfate/molybdate ABC transporter ATP-binding protein [Microbacterium maritypicum]|uniref:sulfate/molybdate ABC transporter ATP-binding protein n=1 Tax=Microbacterium TaxID=33882 RepID=UPI001421EEC9|nr:MULTISPECIES: ABC transporter ATP-binding protein [unclassified Microbacterium]MCV0335823.1 ABC transporter ATP-binding protein [Microbacterium sp.]MCV0376797.1 ABC transporter ATP-binding protein [Microbacterium sp.]MCV0391546.1 ABC transporter ATP-binding protein [Microbacterium sp.]MCV0419953.1 ABC transporter ATP-binding protein [Microbacterium sp.]MCV0423677.1 ABC transporter ATP-binding protein [Microbacterium sp.]
MTLANGLPAERRAAVEPGLRADIVVEREHFAVEVAVQAAVGETVAVMGPSGAGKSTLLQALAGLEPLTAGQIDVAGRVVDRVSAPRVRTTPMNRGIVLLGQDARLFPHLSVRENVAFGPRAAGADAGSARDLADEWLARVGLRGAGGRMPRELSGGEGQRVAVARALAASPRAVLLDEPLVALDPATAGDIRQMLRDQLAGITTIAVTHDAADAVALAERLVIIEAGRVTQSGPVRAVLSAPASEFVASIAGVNRVAGVAAGGAWRNGDLHLTTTDAGSLALAAVDGTPLAAVFRPEHVRVVDAADPDAWRTEVTRLEPTLAGVRVQTAGCAVDVSLADAAVLAPGDAVHLRVDPAHVSFVPVL